MPAKKQNSGAVTPKKKAAKKAPAKTGRPPKKKAAAGTKSTENRAEAFRSSVFYQILPYLVGLFAVFLLVCFAVFLAGGSGKTVGIFGSWITEFLTGLLSGSAYLIPFLLLVADILWKRDENRGVIGHRFIYAGLFLLCFSVFLSLLSGISAYEGKPFTALIAGLWENGQMVSGGGVLGGLLGYALYKTIGTTGGLLVTIPLCLLFLIFLFGLTPHAVYVCIQDRIREKNRILREEQARRREEAELHRQAQKAAMPGGAAEASSRRGAPYIDPVTHTRTAPYVAEEPDSEKDAAENPIEGVPVNDYRSRDRGAEKSAPEITPETAPEASPLPDDSERLEPIRRIIRKHPSIEPETDIDQAKVDPPQNTGSDNLPAVGENPEKLDLDAIFTDPDGNNVLEKFRQEQLRRAGEREQPADAAEPQDTVTDEDLSFNGSLDDDNTAEYELAIRRLRAISSGNGAMPDKSLPASQVTSASQVKPPYIFPPVALMDLDASAKSIDDSEEIHINAVRLVETLRSFKVRTKIVNISRGPTITRYELAPEEGVRVRQIANLVDDIALNLATSGVRIEAPIPGKSAVGIEVPNKMVATVYLRELVDTQAFRASKSLITACLGMDVAGDPIYLDVAKMPHLLIAGATGMGKSVCMNCLIVSLLYKASPEDVKLILIDPKKVELNIYNGLPHLIVPVVSDPKKAAGALSWAVTEMERRFEMIESVGVRDLKHYNEAAKDDPGKETLPQIVILIDELADLMMTAPDDVEGSICRLAQKARAAGMHLIIGTQRPSVDVVTGLIKANIPSRIAFKVSSQTDSRVVIDMAGAEKLIGRGDMLFAPVGAAKPVRVQGAFISEKEVESIVSFIKAQAQEVQYDAEVMDSIEKEAARCGSLGKKSGVSTDSDGDDGNDSDPMLKAAIELAVDSGKISTSLIQRRLSLGYGRSAKLIDRMEQLGIVSAPDGQKPRSVLITKEQYLEMAAGRDD